MTFLTMKRVEIVIDSLYLPRTIELLRRADITGYTVIPGAAGHGNRGERRADEISGVSSNAYILIAAREDRIAELSRAVGPLLRSVGGICLISDCQWLVH